MPRSAGDFIVAERLAAGHATVVPAEIREGNSHAAGKVLIHGERQERQNVLGIRPAWIEFEAFDVRPAADARPGHHFSLVTAADAAVDVAGRYIDAAGKVLSVREKAGQWRRDAAEQAGAVEYFDVRAARELREVRVKAGARDDV